MVQEESNGNVANGLLAPGLHHYWVKSSTCWPPTTTPEPPTRNVTLATQGFTMTADHASQLQAMAKPTTQHQQKQSTQTNTQGARDAKQHKREETYLFMLDSTMGKPGARETKGEGATPDSQTTCKKGHIARAKEYG